MHDRFNTLGLASLLERLVIDLSTELEILDVQPPSIRDHHAILDTTRKLVKMGVAVPGCQIKQDVKEGWTSDAYTITELLEVREYFELKGNSGTAIEFVLWFTEDGSLFKSDVMVYGTTMAKRQSIEYDRWYVGEQKALVFPNVDVVQFVAITKLMGMMAHTLFKMLFNSDYEEDFIQMAELSLDVALSNHLIFVAGNHYGRIADHQNHSFYPKKGYHDLVELAALLFLTNQPQHRDIHFVLEQYGDRGGHMVLAVDMPE